MRDIKFTNHQNEIWRELYARQLPNINKFAGSDYLKGFEILGLSPHMLPSLKELNQKISPLTGWRVIRTNIRYSDTLPWYQHFTRREFIITSYLRSREEMDYTPEPDMFHDIFGHLPFLTLRPYTELLDIFTKAYFSVSENKKDEIKRLGWFTYEFGLIKERGVIKVFGTGILSSKGEIEHVMAGKTPIRPFSVKNVLKRNKAIDTFNRVLFVFDSLDLLKKELSDYFSKISVKNFSFKELGKIKDAEMDLKKYQSHAGFFKWANIK